MPNGRFLARSIAHDVELNSVSLAADLLFERCVPHLDVEGRMPGHPAQVKAIAVPIREEFTLELVDSCLAELARVGLVRWYQVGGRRFLEFPGFVKNQRNLRKDREAASIIPPAPSKPTRTRARKPASQNGSHSGVDPEQVPPDSGPGPAEVEVKSSQVKEPPLSASQMRHPLQNGASSASAIEGLVAFVGEEHRETVLDVGGLPGTTPTWARGVLAQFGPGELLDPEINRIPECRRPRVLALALQRARTDANRWHSPWFRSVFVKAASEDASPPRGSPSADDELDALVGSFTPTERERWYALRDELEAQGTEPEEAARQTARQVRRTA